MPVIPTLLPWIDSHRSRILGLSDQPGPTLLVVAGVHGNEVSGLDASLRVFSELQRQGVTPQGRFLALIGNLAAYQNRARYVEEDLNRIWLPDRVEAELSDSPSTVDAGEMRQLLELMGMLESSATGALTLLDLHTTSSASPPFVAMAGNARAQDISSRIGAVEVRGIAAYLEGMLVNHATRTGWTALAFEAGAHRNIDSIDIHEAFIWHALVACEMIDPGIVPHAVLTRQAQLTTPDKQLGPAVQICYHHPIKPDDNFAMLPGYANFQRVKEGEQLAHDVHGPVVAPEDARIFLPLYQAEGQDGFFLVREMAS